MLGARIGPWRDDAKIPTARDYVQDGLIAMWDGIENAGWGVHDPNATVWKDLVGSLDIPLSSDHWVVGKHYIEKTTFKQLKLRDLTSDIIDALTDGSFTICDLSEIIEFNPEVGGTYYYPCAISLNDASRDYNRFAYEWKATQVDSLRVSYDTESNSAFFNSVRIDPYTKNCLVAVVDRDAARRTLVVNNEDRAERAITLYKPYKAVGVGGYREGTSPKFKCYNKRLYNRVLSPEELSHNYAVDEARFGLT